MSVISFQDRDNVVTNRYTIASGRPSGGSGSWEPTLDLLSIDGLPCSIETILDHLKVDDPDDEEDTVELMARGAAAFIARRTAYSCCPMKYQIILNDTDFSTLKIERGPLRGDPTIEIQTARGEWEAADSNDYWSSAGDRSFVLRKVEGSGQWPRPWQSEGCVRLTFETGFDAYDEDVDMTRPIEPGLLMIFLLITGHYYKNRELIGAGSAKVGVEAVDVKGAESLLGAYRQVW